MTDHDPTILSVELCGRLRDLIGDAIDVTIPRAGSTAADLLAELATRYPPLSADIARGRLRICVNDVVVAGNALVRARDTVALFPPVSGG